MVDELASKIEAFTATTNRRPTSILISPDLLGMMFDTFASKDFAIDNPEPSTVKGMVIRVIDNKINYMELL